MSIWKEIVLVNGGGLVGIIISLFIISPQTPLWLWAMVSAAALAMLNYVCFGWRRTVGGKSKNGAKSTVIIALGLAVLLVDLLLRHLHR
jgi:hypothetical protein